MSHSGSIEETIKRGRDLQRSLPSGGSVKELFGDPQEQINNGPHYEPKGSEGGVRGIMILGEEVSDEEGSQMEGFVRHEIHPCPSVVVGEQ